MGRRYYCDYCDKTFIDDIDARKKHINSVVHQRIKKEHYLNCRDPKTLLAEEIVKLPCRRFQHTGECQFYGNCKYTHYSQEEMWQVKSQIDLEEQHKQDENKNKETPTIESWLDKYNQKKSNIERKECTMPSISWHYPDKLELIPDLPPSLVRFKPEQFRDSNFETWG